MGRKLTQMKDKNVVLLVYYSLCNDFEDLILLGLMIKNLVKSKIQMHTGLAI